MRTLLIAGLLFMSCGDNKLQQCKAGTTPAPCASIGRFTCQDDNMQPVWGCTVDVNGTQVECLANCPNL